ncbi:MAG: DNA primase [Candidatus Pacebacteria bacterium]|nr:DNA primase [Candidatus Paceibacterota bacterium]
MLESPIDEIKSRLDIVDVVKEYVKLEKAGINYRARCPFHSEKTPSFFVNPSRQIWHCFGSCGEGGDMFKFIMKIEGVEFGDALRILANKAGVKLTKEDPKLKSAKQRTYEICEWALKFFEKQLDSTDGKKVVNYLNNRGIDNSQIKKWRVGYSPNDWTTLLTFLSGKGYSGSEVEAAGLAIKKEETGRFYDRFRGRIMFPIFDFNSQPIGFGGRILEGDKEAKYLNTPNTVLYDKSRVLYGLDKAKNRIREADACILVEGYTDVIMSHFAGFENTVSSSGTALTNYQLSIIKRYTDNLITAFDMDDAGSSATSRGIDLAQAMGFNIKVVIMPEGVDPADMAKDKEGWGQAVTGAVSVMDFYFQKAVGSKDASLPENKKKIAEYLLPKIAKISSNIEKDHWVQKLAQLLNVKESSVISDMNKIKVEDSKPLENNNLIEGKKSRKHLIEDRFLMILSSEPGLIKEIKDKSIFSEDCLSVIDYLDGKDSSIDDIKEQVDVLSMRASMEDFDSKTELFKCVDALYGIHLKNKLADINEKIREAESKKDVALVDNLMKDFVSIYQKLNNIEKES